MRFSGVVLVFLVLGHLFIMTSCDGGVHRIDFNFVAGAGPARSGRSGTC